MIHTSAEAIAELERREYPTVFREIHEGRIPLQLAGSCSTPDRYFRALGGLMRLHPAVKNYIPLWETNGEVVVAYDMLNDRYIRYFYEPNIQETLGDTYQQFITAFLLELVDSGVWEELDAVAEQFHYKYTVELRAFVTSCDDTDFDGSNRRFVRSIPD